MTALFIALGIILAAAIVLVVLCLPKDKAEMVKEIVVKNADLNKDGKLDMADVQIAKKKVTEEIAKQKLTEGVKIK
jgi:hypothetical protein